MEFGCNGISIENQAIFSTRIRELAALVDSQTDCRLPCQYGSAVAWPTKKKEE